MDDGDKESVEWCWTVFVLFARHFCVSFDFADGAVQTRQLLNSDSVYTGRHSRIHDSSVASTAERLSAAHLWAFQSSVANTQVEAANARANSSVTRTIRRKLRGGEKMLELGSALRRLGRG